MCYPCDRVVDGVLTRAKEKLPAFLKRYQAGFAVLLAVLVNLMEACVFGSILFPATFRDVTVRRRPLS